MMHFSRAMSLKKNSEFYSKNGFLIVKIAFQKVDFRFKNFFIDPKNKKFIEDPQQNLSRSIVLLMVLVYS